MAKKRADGDQQEPNLELPSLFGRGKKRRRGQPDEPAQDISEPAPQPVPQPVPQSVEEPVEQPAAWEPFEETRPVAPVSAEPLPPPAPEPKRRATRANGTPKPPKPTKSPKPQRAARSGPVLPPGVAAIVTGLVVGLAGTALTYVSLRGCEMLKGTESCGAPGLGLLVVIIVLMMLGGALLLGLLGVSEPRGTSFLAIGLMCVIVLVTLMEDLFSVWMFVAVPLICAATYALAHWVTTQFVETADDRPHVDVR